MTSSGVRSAAGGLAAVDAQVATLPYVYGDLFGALGIDLSQYEGTNTRIVDLLNDGVVTPAQLEAAGYGHVPSIDDPNVDRNYAEYVARVKASVQYGGVGEPRSKEDWWRIDMGYGGLGALVTTRAGGYTTNVHGQDVGTLVFVDERGDVVEDAYIPPQRPESPQEEVPRYLIDGVEQYADGTPVPGGYRAADDLARQLAEQGVSPATDPAAVESIDAASLTPDVGTPGSSTAVALPATWTAGRVLLLLLVVAVGLVALRAVARGRG